MRALILAAGLLALTHEWRAQSSPPGGADDLPVLAAQSRHLESLGVPAWHRAGVRGAGVKVAVLDSGFRDYRDHLGSTLPACIAVKSFRADGDLEARDSCHGVMCGEVIHALAPDAELMFANWEPDHPETFVEAVRWCRSQGATLISCSVVMPAWSDGEGGGDVHRELAGILGQGTAKGDVVAVACAGNLAPRHWGGRFRDDGHHLHQWDHDRVENPLTPWGGGRVSVELLCPPKSCYAIEVIDATENKSVGETLTHPGPDRFATATRFSPQAGHQYRLRARLLEGPGAPIHVVALGAWMEYHSSRGSIPFPGDGAEWLTVGAVDSDGRRASYSSCGPVAGGPKPDVVAPVPFPTLSRNPPFSGTSAAAPQAAGLAALVWSRHPDWTASRIRQAITGACRACGRAGPDCETGFGCINLGALR